jgi:hypothetical protein
MAKLRPIPDFLVGPGDLKNRDFIEHFSNYHHPTGQSVAESSVDGQGRVTSGVEWGYVLFYFKENFKCL